MLLSPSKVSPPIYAAVQAVMLSKQRSTPEEGLTNEGRNHLLLLHKQAHDKSGIAESLHAYINRAKTNSVCKVFSKEISQLSKIHPPLYLRRHGIFSENTISAVSQFTTCTGLASSPWLPFTTVYSTQSKLEAGKTRKER